MHCNDRVVGYDRWLDEDGHRGGLVHIDKDDVQCVASSVRGRFDHLLQTEAAHLGCEFHCGRVSDDVKMDVDVAQSNNPLVVDDDHLQ